MSRSNNFQKAIASAKKISKERSAGVERWLKQDAKKYGYTYGFRCT